MSSMYKDRSSIESIQLWKGQIELIPILVAALLIIIVLLEVIGVFEKL